MELSHMSENKGLSLSPNTLIWYWWLLVWIELWSAKMKNNSHQWGFKKKSLSKVKYQYKAGQNHCYSYPGLVSLVAFGTCEPSHLVWRMLDFWHQHWIALWGTHIEIPTVSRSPLELSRFLECNPVDQGNISYRMSPLEDNSFWLHSSCEPHKCKFLISLKGNASD